MLSLLLIMLVRKEKVSVKDIKNNLVLLVVSGIVLGMNWILLFEAYNYTTVAVATLCYYMAPIFIIIVSPVLLKERITFRKAACILVALAGMILVSGVLNTGNKPTDYRGILFGLGAAVLYACVVILNKKISGISAYDKTIVQLGVSGIVLLPYVLLTAKEEAGNLSLFVVFMVLIVGIVHTGLAYALYFGSMKNLPAQTVAMFSYIDPVIAILVSVLVLSEKIGRLENVGILCVLCSTIISELPQKKSGQAKT